MRSAAIRRNSASRSRLIRSRLPRYSRYSRVMTAMGMSWMSIFFFLIRKRSRSSGPSKTPA